MIKTQELFALRLLLEAPFEIENKTIVFENNPFSRYETEGDFLQIQTNPKFDERDFVDGQILHIFVYQKEKQWFATEISKDRTVIQKYL